MIGLLGAPYRPTRCVQIIALEVTPDRFRICAPTSASMQRNMVI